MDKILHKVLQDQQAYLENVRGSLGNPDLTKERLEVLNNNALAMKMYCGTLSDLDFKDYDAVKEWL